MKFSERWLRAWIDPPVDSDGLADQLTSLGLEVDGIESARPGFTGVVVGKIIAARQHPDADRLRVCEVDAGEDQPLQVVCGAPNAREGLLTAFARVGGGLPDGTKLKKAKLRGVVSFGMLCSAAELGLSEERGGIMELAGDARPGVELAEWLALDDSIIDVDLTPDRGDCLCIRGIARDLSARNDLPVAEPLMQAAEVTVEDSIGISIDPASACARFTGRIIRGVDMTRAAPDAIVERLRGSGVRSINLAVDVTNHVMLELGQPMHAFDLDKLQGDVHVRLAQQGEALKLLDGREIELDSDTTVIADDSGAIAVAGIMGGDSTAVDAETKNIFFESALFLPGEIIGKPRRYATHTDSSHRFERGVDPAGQRSALEAATRLLLDMSGGQPGPVCEQRVESRLPQRKSVALRAARLTRILGTAVPNDEVERILGRLGIDCLSTDAGWMVTPPSARYDLEIEEDFIEEVGRVRGYDSLAHTLPVQRATFRAAPESELSPLVPKRVLVHRGYQEVVTYSFVDETQQALLRPDLDGLVLPNPISRELGVMRTTLVGGLLDVYRRNASRQVESMRLLESGLRFLPASVDEYLDPTHGDDIQLDGSVRQQSMLAGLLVGRQAGESWNTGTAPVDFFSAKADVEALFGVAAGTEVRFVPGSLPMLHPGQSATIMAGSRAVGYVGVLNPTLQGALDLPALPLVFEVSLAAVMAARLPVAGVLSRYPGIRRDLAAVVDDAVTHDSIVETVRQAGGKLLRDVFVFDLYRGEALGSGKKSVALGLILQDFSRTLAESDAERTVARVVSALEREHAAEWRG